MTPTMHYSKDGLHLTEQFEGCKFRAYQDEGGVWTIGFGHTRNVKEGDTCTFERAILWLEQDVAVAEATVNSAVIVPLTQHQFDALVDFCFNIGATKFTKSTCLKLLNQKQYELADDEFLKWHHINGKDSKGLLNRRKAEQELYNA